MCSPACNCFACDIWILFLAGCWIEHTATLHRWIHKDDKTKVVEFSWEPIMKDITTRDQSLLNCVDCWASSACRILAALIKLVAPDIMSKTKPKCNIEGCSHGLAIQELMEGLVTTRDDPQECNIFLERMLETKLSDEATVILQLLGIKPKSKDIPVHHMEDEYIHSCYTYHIALAWEWVKQNRIRFECEYGFKIDKYEEGTEYHYIGNTFKPKKGNSSVGISGWDGFSFVGKNNFEISLEQTLAKEKKIMAQIVKHPVSGSFNYLSGTDKTKSKFEKLKSEVYTVEQIRKNAAARIKRLVRHEMPIIGFKTKEYYLVANSLDDSFGVRGIGKILFNSKVTVPYDDPVFSRYANINKISWPLLESSSDETTKSSRDKSESSIKRKGMDERQEENTSTKRTTAESLKGSSRYNLRVRSSAGKKLEEVSRKTHMHSLQEDDDGFAGESNKVIAKPTPIEDDTTFPPSRTASIQSQVTETENSHAEEHEGDSLGENMVPQPLFASQTSMPRLTSPCSPPSLFASASPIVTSKPESPRCSSMSFSTSRGFFEDRSSISLSGYDADHKRYELELMGKKYLSGVGCCLTAYEQFGALLANVKELPVELSKSWKEEVVATEE